MQEKDKILKFLIDRLLILLGMCGSFIGATLGYLDKIIELIGKNGTIFLLIIELSWIVIFGIILVIAIVKTFKFLIRKNAN